MDIPDQGDKWDPEEYRFLLEMLHEYARLLSLSGISRTEMNAHGFSSSAGLTAAVLYS